MGLDMFLTARRPLFGAKGYDIKGVPAGYEINEVSVEIAYWRKANAIHNWFVQEVMEGKNFCGSYVVSRYVLVKLRDTCSEVIANREKTRELLPTLSGFFFGGTDYDEHYFKTLERTVPLLNNGLNDFKHEDLWTFEYYASW